jgi:hypothetical protein
VTSRTHEPETDDLDPSSKEKRKPKIAGHKRPRTKNKEAKSLGLASLQTRIHGKKINGLICGLGTSKVLN